MSDSINEQRCEQCGNGIEANCHVYTFAPGFHSFERPGPSVVTPPAQDGQRRCTCAWTAPAPGQYHSVATDAQCVVRGVAAVPSVSTDHTDETYWRKNLAAVIREAAPPQEGDQPETYRSGRRSGYRQGYLAAADLIERVTREDEASDAATLQ